MHGLEVLESMNNREMNRYHKEQRRKKDAIKSVIQQELSEYIKTTNSTESLDLLCRVYDIIDTADLDLENREDL